MTLPLDRTVDPRPRIAVYRPVIEWGSGTDVGTTLYDDLRRFYLNTPGLIIDGIGRDQVRAYSPPAAPAFDLMLNNWGGEFSPGGPIGALVGRGSHAYLDVDWAGETHRLFDGEVNTADHVLTRPQRSVAVRALGRFTLLVDQRPRTTQLYEDIRTDQAISILLDLCGWDPSMRLLDTGDTELAYWWLDGSEDGVSVLNGLLQAEGAGGAAYEQAGVFHFEGRQFRANNYRSVNEQWVIGGAGINLTNAGANDPVVMANDDNALANGVNQVIVLQDTLPSEYASNPDEVISSATLTVNVRAPFPEQVGGAPAEVAKVWEWGSALTVPSGPDGVIIEGTVSDPYKDALLPVNGTSVPAGQPADYAVRAGSGTLDSVTLLSTSGTFVRIKWVSASGCIVDGWTSDGPQLRAVSLPITAQVVVRSTIDTTAQRARYRPREFRMDAWPEIDANRALDIVNSMVLRYRDERRQATLRITNLDPEHMYCILHAQVGDRLRWRQRHGVIDEPYWVEQIHHEIAPGGGLHVMTLGCERVYEPVGARFGDEGPPPVDYGGRFGNPPPTPVNPNPARFGE